MAQDATNIALLGGVREQANGLWSVSVLAGGPGGCHARGRHCSPRRWKSAWIGRPTGWTSCG
ncbi:hypothetical protein GT370_05000 [Acidocella sp. MX-AZ03]|uniref:hypothetical protein n=1 Tax=Acidocella sp. MX-AZ03 TaxID=2697363 RepID=UPI0022DD164C|nr:hypothetical protein [Acidocella sp. MX-AZ03]WBO60192.1 hypothetical protein GT370_05000 [Acidocella sp. MX-AZ03]